MSPFGRHPDPSALAGPTRVVNFTDKPPTRIRTGDIVLLDLPDMDRRAAQAILRRQPAAIVNVAPMASGTLPAYGPQLLADANIVLVEAVGAELWRLAKDGRKATLDTTGALRYGNTLVATGRPVDPAQLAATYTTATHTLAATADQLGQGFATLLTDEAPLYIDGFGIPDTRVHLTGKKVIIVSDTPTAATQLKGLRNFIREYDPVIIGAGFGAQHVTNAGYQPDIILGDPTNLSETLLTSGAVLLIPATPQGDATGIDRVHDLAVAAMTFPAETSDPTDLAILFAHYHHAAVIVHVGDPLTVDTALRSTPTTVASTQLARLYAAHELVPAAAIIALYTVDKPLNLSWLYTLLGLLAVTATLLLLVALLGDGSPLANLTGTANQLGNQLRQLTNQGR
ncbi:putative cytokinetic ring protein SteA [Corynebacterium choanae]|uniref:Thiamine pyrophosphokinase n=1 Tax=Corynebacterium choanae TaxID=1862358 RepID=A0A3G6J6B3_9CORY|nr:putative cytokinetic ring protein SteA [Corynebacterium choanae]AZA13486.1 hypothetical protein CCHOA_05425 [Corynebacterium choanae]